MRSKGVEVTALDIVEQHLNRGHAEVVGTQVEDRESQLVHYLLGFNSSMVGGVVQHDHSVLPPVDVKRVKMSAELKKEEAEGLTVGLPTVSSIPDLACAAHGCNDVDPFQALASCDQVLLRLHDPASLPTISVLDHRLIYVDDSITCSQRFNELGGGELPLILGLVVVVDVLDWLHQAIGCIHVGPHVLSQVRSTDSHPASQQQDSLDVSELDWTIGILEHRLDHLSCPAMDLIEPPAFGGLPLKQVRVGLPTLP